MIKTSLTEPDIVQFEQKIDKSHYVDIAARQIAKAASDEVVATSEVDKAAFRLSKATESLQASSLAYFASVEHGRGNQDELRKEYNNALAGFRDADQHSRDCDDALLLAKGALAGVRAMAKGQIPNTQGVMVEDGPSQPDDSSSNGVAESGGGMIANRYGVMVPDDKVGKAAVTNGASLKAAISAAKTPADKAACVAAAARLKMPFFLPKGWKAQYGGGAASDSSDKSDTSAVKKEYPFFGDITTVVKAAEVEIEDEEVIEKHMVLVLCPNCMGAMGGGCSMCAGYPDSLIPAVSADDSDDSSSSSDSSDSSSSSSSSSSDFSKSVFDTENLLMRDFQKSVSYQEYVAKKESPSDAE